MKNPIVAVVGFAAIVAAAPALADSTEGTVVAYDRVARVLVLSDRTVYSLGADLAAVAEGLSRGDVVKIEFTSAGESGIQSIDRITIQEDEE